MPKGKKSKNKRSSTRTLTKAQSARGRATIRKDAKKEIQRLQRLASPDLLRPKASIPQAIAHVSRPQCFRLEVAYPGKLYDAKHDRRIEKAVGRQSDGSGMAFWKRDIGWTFKDEKSVATAIKRLRRASKVLSRTPGMTAKLWPCNDNGTEQSTSGMRIRRR